MEELRCPVCRLFYEENNLPRILTICGHTFCHKCIKGFVTKKKDQGFRVKCPIDKGMMEMEKPNPNMFPKNLVLINLMNRNKQSLGVQKNEFLEISSKAKLPTNQNIVPSSKKLIEQKLSNRQVSLQQISQKSIKDTDTCIIHRKDLEVYCVNDLKRYCTDCALFSHDRSHQMKNIQQLIKTEESNVKKLRQILKEREEISTKLMNDDIQSEIYELLDKKKQLVRSQVQCFFDDFRKVIDKRQEAMYDELQGKILAIGGRIKSKMKISQNVLQSCEGWEKQVHEILVRIQFNQVQNVDIRLQNLITNRFYEDHITKGKQILTQMNNQQVQFVRNIQTQLQHLKLHTETQSIRQIIQNGINLQCKLSTEKKQSSLNEQRLQEINRTQAQKTLSKNLNGLKVKDGNLDERLSDNSKVARIEDKVYGKENLVTSFNQDCEEQSLLDFQTSFQPKTHLIESGFSCNNISTISIKYPKNDQHPKKQEKSIAILQKKKSGIMKRVESLSSLTKKRSGSTTSVSSSVLNRSSSFLAKTPERKRTSFRRTDHQSAYSGLIKEIIQNKHETLDLSGAQIQLSDMLSIISSIPQTTTIKSIKLMRMNLNDEFIKESFENLSKIQRVNIAQNKLTQVSVDFILSQLKRRSCQNMNKNACIRLKYLNMGQNRVVQRKNRKVLQEFKKMGVEIVL